jgi:hypothetical protein
MAPLIDGPPDPADSPRPVIRRLGWFFAIAAASALATAIVAYGLEALLPR